MDSKVVTREIRRYIWPQIRAFGFSRFTGRTAWRHSNSKIDVVNFQSFNSYLAEGVGCTTYSFAINLGCYFPVIPWEYSRPLRQKGALLIPEEFQCHLRLHLDKSLKQPELPRANIWLIREDGKYLPEAISDATSAVLEKGMPWFEQFDDYEFLLNQLTSDESASFGTGARWSPRRHYLIGYMARAVGNSQLALRHLEMAVNSGCFKHAESQLKSTIQELTSCLM